jgi:hypothetical protein
MRPLRFLSTPLLAELALALVNLPPLVAADAAIAPAVRTADGLELRFERDGAVAVRLDERELATVRKPALLFVRDANASGVFVPLACEVAARDGAVVLRSRDNALGFDVTARIANRGGFLEIDGIVGTRAPAERAIDLRVCLPLDTTSFALGSGLGDGAAPPRPRARAAKKAAPSNVELDESVPDDNALYPLCVATARSGAFGLTLAVPPTHPTRFVTGSDAAGAHVLLRVGVSQFSATPGQTPFRLILYRHDPAWGFRAALARYYEFYRADFFTRRVKRIGAWTSQNPSKLRNPQLYAYHEAGFPTWRHPDGTDSGVNVKLTLERLDEGPQCATLEDYERLCELALDEKLGIYSLPYTIVGQRQLLQLPALPHDRAEAMRVLDTWTPAAPILFDGPPQAVSFRSAEELKQIIRASTLHDAEHQLTFMPRPYRGPTLTFPQNPSPRLFADRDEPTIARYTLDYYLPMMFRSKFVDGCYLDSLGRWCGLYNYRTDHFRYATAPLTYAGSPAQPCIWNLQSHAEYIWELTHRLHAQDKIVLANGVHPDRMLLGFACDVMGAEGGRTYDSGEGFYALRVTAGPKPYCVLNAAHKVTPRLWNSCLYLGFLMGCNDPKGLADEEKFLPAIIACNEAGWAPVTRARATPSAVGVERWGGDQTGGRLFFTVMNRSTEPIVARVALDLAALHVPAAAEVVSIVEPLKLEIRRGERELIVHVPLQAEQAVALEVRSR